MSTERKTHNIKAVGLSFFRVLLRNIAWETAVQYLWESCSEEVEKEANLRPLTPPGFALSTSQLLPGAPTETHSVLNTHDLKCKVLWDLF